jgi:hypothetical protein
VTAALARLRPYQLPVARAVLDSVINQRGLTFVCRMSRQAGKNETSAQLEAALLALANAGVLPPASLSIVKAAPTLTPQTKRSRARLISTLRAAGLRFSTGDQVVRVGNAWTSFASGEPNANVVGDTAGLLLEIDEAQDFDIDTYDKKFAPFRAAFNATAVLWGTAWSDVDLLERERQAALRAAALDGVRRVFDVEWREVARHVPAYGAFVAAEQQRLGPTHPLFVTQYELQTLAGEGKLLSPDALAQLAGSHARTTTRPTAARIVAGLDLAGGADSGATSHDRTVLTLGAVTGPSPADPIQQNHVAVLHHISWLGEPHERLLPQLRDLLRNVWHVDKIAVDATGLGETIARVLTSTLGDDTVLPVKFTRSSKSALGFALIETTATGRLKLYEPDASADAITCWDELTKCRRELLPGQLIDWRVPEDEGHDDYVTSLALMVHAANAWESRVARGRRP